MKKIFRRLPQLFVSLSFLILSFSSSANIYPFANTYTGGQEVPANASPGKGMIVGYYNDVTNTINFTIIFGGLLTNTTAAHFHSPATTVINAPVIIAYAGFPAGVTQGQYSNSYVITDLQETQLLAGQWYSNIHTTGLPGGEIRTQIILSNQDNLYLFNNLYSGTQEVPPNASAATGRIIGGYDRLNNQVNFGLIFSGLTTPASAAHFHAPASPGSNAPVIINYTGFPNATSGTYFGTGAVNATTQMYLYMQQWYSNIHNATFPGGEIRAQITPNIPPIVGCSPREFVADAGKCSATRPLSASNVFGFPIPVHTFSINGNPVAGNYEFPVGATTVNVTATNTGGIATCSYTVTVTDNQAPVIGAISPSQNNLWPPNNKMRDITISYSVSDNCPGVTASLSVTSNEATGNQQDWIIVDAHHLKLRAQRNGNGNGRIYTITATATDQSGNTSSKSTTVNVDHDKGHRPVVGSNEIITTTFKASVTPNPSAGYFVLNLQSPNANEKVSIKVFDIAGRLVDERNNISTNSSTRFGDNLKPGIYVLKMIQGETSVQMRMVKIE